MPAAGGIKRGRFDNETNTFDDFLKAVAGLFKTEKSVYKQKQDCSICFYSKDCKSVCKQCTLRACGSCISKWLETNYTCPQCRAPLKEKPRSPKGLRILSVMGGIAESN